MGTGWQEYTTGFIWEGWERFCLNRATLFSQLKTSAECLWKQSSKPLFFLIWQTHVGSACLLKLSPKTVIFLVSWWIGLPVAELPGLVTSLQGVCALSKWQGLTLCSASPPCLKGWGRECLQAVAGKENLQGRVHHGVGRTDSWARGGRRKALTFPSVPWNLLMNMTSQTTPCLKQALLWPSGT